jgi:NitT/TauT family transport system ATP-binding protein
MQYTWPLWRTATRDERMSVSQTASPSRDAVKRNRTGQGRSITIEKLCKAVGDSVLYEDLDLRLPTGEFISIVGPSGSDHATLIQMMSGLTPYDGGQVLYDGKPLGETRVAYVFRDHRKGLLPWLSAIDNIRHPLAATGLTREEQDKRIVELISGLDLGFNLRAYPYELGSGQNQIVAILRCLAMQPEVLFLEAPFADLKPSMKRVAREQLQKIFLRTGTTMVLVTEDVDEALQMSDRILLLAHQPPQLVDIIMIDLQWPRRAEVISTPRFVELKRRCLGSYRQDAAA